MKTGNRRLTLLSGAIAILAACTNPIAEPANDAASRRTEESPSNGGMFGSGHNLLPAETGTLTLTSTTPPPPDVEQDSTSRSGGGMFGSGH
jgi:hypothetical protein